jgi:serine/threonine protein kinase
MYEMLTGILPYDTPTPSDLEKLMSGKLVTAPRLRNKKIPTQVSDIVMRAMAPKIPNRYQRASDLHDALTEEPSFRSRPTVSHTRSASEVNRITSSLGTRVTPTPKFCHNCSKPLPDRLGTLSKCQFCGAEIEP